MCRKEIKTILKENTAEILWSSLLTLCLIKMILLSYSTFDLYNDLYLPYLNKLRAINLEMQVREEELAKIRTMNSVEEKRSGKY